VLRHSMARERRPYRVREVLAASLERVPGDLAGRSLPGTLERERPPLRS
jgi:hypothetical protein